ncbi:MULTISPECIES: hypothetical protein [unclassified Novosphingobium]|uniref:hypothetical protein n=1 Tax=unclassified Novosphingobium TaxID=2644732 RepID=UPI00135BD150|nr:MULTISPECIES: hypothetical protein [unclassified Novosphingobium]
MAKLSTIAGVAALLDYDGTRKVSDMLAGGYQTAAGIAARNALPAARRRNGMLVRTADSALTWVLSKDNANAADAGTWMLWNTDGLANLPAADQAPTDTFVPAVGTSAFYNAPVRSIAYSIEPGVDVPVGREMRALGGYMIASPDAAVSLMRVYRRAMTSAQINAAPGAAGDVLIDEVSATVAALALTVGTRTLAFMPLSGPIVARAGFIYVVEHLMLNALGAAVQIGWQAVQNAAAMDQRRRGWFRTTDPQNVVSPSLIQWYVRHTATVTSIAVAARDATATSAAAVAGLATTVNAQAPQVSAVRDTVGALAAADRTETAYQQPAVGTFAFTDVTCRAVAFFLMPGANLPVGQALSQIGGRMVATANAVTVRVRVWRRPLNSAGLNLYPGLAADDSLVGSGTAKVTDLNLQVGTRTDGFVPLVNALPIEEGYGFAVEMVMLDANGAPVQIGWGAGQDASFAAQYQRGWWFSSAVQASAAPNFFQSFVKFKTTLASIAKRALSLAQSGAGNPAKALQALCPSIGMEGLRLIGVAAGANDNSTPQTFHAVIETAQGFDAIRLVFSNSSTSQPVVVAGCKVSTRGDMDTGFDNNNAASWVAVTFGGNASGTAPVVVGDQRNTYLVSDWIMISSADRTDGRRGGIVVARAYVSNPVSLLVPDFEDVAAAAVRTTGYAYSFRRATGDAVSVTGGFGAAAHNRSTVFAGVSYAARGKVCNFLTVGDSTVEGYADTVRSDAYAVRTARHYNNPDAIAWEASNIAWTGSTTARTFDRWQAFFATGLPASLVLYLGGSANDHGVAASANPIALTPAIVAPMRQRRIRAGQMMRERQMTPIFATWGPYSAGTFNYGATDAVRQADCAAIMTMGGVLAVDLAAGLYGSTAANGQQETNPAYATDRVHAIGAGYDALVDGWIVPLIDRQLGLTA